MKKTNTYTITLATLAAAILTLTAACGGSATKVVVAQGYKKQFAIDAALALAIMDRAPEVIYYGDLKKSLGKAGTADTGAAANAFVWEYFTAQMLRDIAGEIDVKGAFAAVPKNDFLVTKEVVITRDEDVKIEIPDVGTRFTFDSGEAALVLFLHDIRVGTETDPYYQERAEKGFYTTIARKLIYIASFVLWDNRELKPICYGRVKTSTPIIREEATIADWEEVSRDFVRAAFDPTGFRKRGKD